MQHARKALQYKAVYSVDAKGKVKKLSTQKGENSASFSSGMKYFVNVYSSFDTPPVTTLCSASGKVLKTLIDNSEVKNVIDADAPVTKRDVRVYNLGRRKIVWLDGETCGPPAHQRSIP